MPSAILPVTYLGSIQYFSKFISYKDAVIECYEHFIKQTYRNRCEIYGANGKQTLVIPVKKPDGNKTLIKDIVLDYAENWPLNHFRSIEAAYRSSPFYEFYIDEIKEILLTKHDLLIEFNLNLTKSILNHLEIPFECTLTEKYTENSIETDYRFIFSPKRNATKQDDTFTPIQYNQVFAEKHGFIKNLSIIDLLFNEGPNAVNILNQSIKRG